MTTKREGYVEIDILPDVEGFNEAMRRQEEQRRLHVLSFAESSDLGYHAIGLDQPHGPTLVDLLREPDWVTEVRQIADRAMTEQPDAPEIQQPPKWSNP